MGGRFLILSLSAWAATTFINQKRTWKMSVKFREHRGGLSESMETTVEVENRAGLIAHVFKLLEPFYFERARIDAGLTIEPYSWGSETEPFFDERIGWHLHIVTLKGYGVLGFTNGPLNE
jgi:hypothetical protein